MSPESHGLSGERPKGVKDEAKRANETPARSLAPDPDPRPDFKGYIESSWQK